MRSAHYARSAALIAVLGAGAASPAAFAAGVADVLAQAQQAYAELEFEQVLSLSEQVLGAADATVDQRMDAYFLQGSALAVVGRAIDAEASFRYLLRGRPDFDVPDRTPPKIVAVFRKVQAEERAILEQVRGLERKRILDSLTMTATLPDEPRGGVPLAFIYSVRDPSQAVASLRVRYRRAGESDFSSLALARDDTGRWLGELPGEWSENDDGFTLEYFATTFDHEGAELISDGGVTAARTMAIAPGSVAGAAPFYAQPWFWGVSAGATLAVAAAAGVVVVVATLPPASDLPVNRLD
jgi:hypothetical protein